ncbi:MAG TPA: multicopper oxidase domain-containing protein [Terriglobales bacterium]|nr:multicopper oxidase domain-containing protein [Terriglobales bacterium]
MQRRAFLKLSSVAAASTAVAARVGPGLAQAGPKPDFTLTIAPITVELAPNHIISTIGYNGTAPGPLLRMKEGAPVTVEVINQTDVPEQVHWHGLEIPAEVDGAEEEGTPAVPPQGRRSYRFTPRPAGTRWYHTHTMAMSDLHRGGYTGQFGFLVIEGASNPAQAGHFDQELFLALRDWEPFYTSQMVDTDDLDPTLPQPEKPAVLDTRPNGLEIGAGIYSINDKALGAGEPIRVKPGDRLLLHLLNASAIEIRHLALPGHEFHVIALDGNPVPTPQAVEVLLLGPGERIDCYVEMNQPGVWIMGDPTDDIRNAGLGVIVEYAGQNMQPTWTAPRKLAWDYTIFGKPGAAPAAAPANVMDMVFEKIPRGAGRFNSFTVNGKPYPHDQEFVMKAGQRHRLVFHNRTDDSHPLHLHRHVFELAEIYGKPTAGVMKDTVVVPIYGRAAVDFTADQPGPSLFHCHIQMHMDYGFKALLRA